MIEVTKHGGQAFAVVEDGTLLAVCVYRKGAVAVRERLEALQASITSLEAKCAAMHEPLVWEDYLSRPEVKDSLAAHEETTVKRASESDSDGYSRRHRRRHSTGTKGE